MTKRNCLVGLALFALAGCAIAEEHDFYRYLRYPAKLVDGAGRDKVAQVGGDQAVGYKRRTVQWFPRKGQDIVDIPAGAPLRTWTRITGKNDPSTLTGMGKHWPDGDSETFKAHLVALRGFGTSTDIPGYLHPYVPIAVLRMGDGRQLAVTDCGPLCRMVSPEDGKFIYGIWEKAYPKLYATVTQTPNVTRRKNPAGGHKAELELRKWTEASPKFNAVSPRKDAKYPIWGKDDETVVFETPHYYIIARPKSFGNPRKWINPKNIEAQNLYRKCVMEFAENFWTYVEAAGASMPFWRLEGENYKYVVHVRDSGHGGSGGWMHCGVGDIRPNVLGHELFHSMPNGGWDGLFLETMCDSGMHTSVPGQMHMFRGNFSYPWRNVNRVAYKASLWCFVLGDNPNWGYGINTVLGSLASPAEPTPYHTVARLGQKKGLWKNGVRGFGDFFGEYAARMVTCDFVQQLMIRGKYGTPPLSHVYPVYGHKERYRISNAQAPRWCGYNTVRLKPEKGAEEITVDFQGIEDPYLHADWRACIVAVDDAGRARYSPLWNKGRMTFVLKASDRRLWLTVAAAPSAFPVLPAGKRGAWGDTYLTGIHAPRYPWEVVLSGCEPGRPHRMQGDVVNLDDLHGMCDGDRNFWDRPVKQEVPILLTDDEGKLAQAKLKALLVRIESATEALSGKSQTPAPPRSREWGGQKRAALSDMAIRAKFLIEGVKGRRHPNGGGFVSDNARVAKTAYVGPNAMVLNEARVEGNACIKGSAVIFGPGPVISGNAKVGGKAWVFGNIDLGGDARILEAATVSTTSDTRQNPGKRRVKITGSAVIKGDTFVQLRGADMTLTEGIVVDYTPSLNVGDKGEFKYGRFCNPPPRRGRISLTDGADAGAIYANWEFNQAQGVTLADSYVNNSGILYGGPEFAADEGRHCIVFNGKDQYAEAPPSVADFGALTIDIRLKRPAGKGGRLFDFGTGFDECFYLTIGAQNGKPALIARHGGKTSLLTASQAVAPDKWVRVRVEMDGKTASIYIDGKKAGSKNFAFSPRMVFIGDSPVGNFIGCGRKTDDFFTGRLDHFRIYRKVHEKFDGLAPAPFAMTQTRQRPPEDKKNARGKGVWEFQQMLKYHASADWEDRTAEEIKDKAPPKMKKWLKDVRGY